METPPVTVAAAPVRTARRRLWVAAEIPLRRPTVLMSPSWIPNTNSRSRIFRSISRFLPPRAALGTEDMPAGLPLQLAFERGLTRPPVRRAEPAGLQGLQDAQCLLNA